MADVSTSFSIPNDEISDDTSPTVARKFLNEVKDTLVTLQHVVKHRMNGNVTNVSSSTHQEIHKIFKDKIVPLVNQVDSRIQNFKNHFVKEVAEFVRDFKSLAKEADDSLDRIKVLEKENDLLLRAVFSQDIMSVVQMISESKSDKLSYDKAYKDMQHQIERLQAQLGDLKGKSINTPSTSNTLEPVSQKVEDENVSLEFHSTRVNNQFTKQSILGKPPSYPKLVFVTPFPKSTVFPKAGELNALSKQVTSNSVPSSQVKNDRVITPGMFRINPSRPSKVGNVLPNNSRASVRTTLITDSQLHVIHKENVNSNPNGFSSTGVKSTTKTRRPQPRSNTKNDMVPSASKSYGLMNKEVKVEEHHRSLLLSNNKKHISSDYNNIKLAIRNAKSKVVGAMCKKCLIISNHDDCVLNYVNDMNSRSEKQKANVSNNTHQKKQMPNVRKPKKVESKERLTSPKPSSPRTCLRWSPTRRFFDLKGKIIKTSESDADNAYTTNPREPIRKWFLNSTFSLAGTVRFGNVHVDAIMGYGDIQWGNILIARVYYVEGPGHNLFSVGQFCDLDLEDAFRRNTCYVRNLDGSIC
ncbi:hypothetical protein Tco_0481190 [Tanacetum coccineum]